MGCYPSPAKGDTLYLSRDNAGTWTIEKHTKESGVWASRVLAASDTQRLARPMTITGIGPLETIYSAINSYTATPHTTPTTTASKPRFVGPN